MNKMMLYGGIVLIIVAIILGSIQHFNVNNINIYGDSANKLPFYGSVGAIGLIGIILAVWSYMKKEVVAPKPA